MTIHKTKHLLLIIILCLGVDAMSQETVIKKYSAIEIIGEPVIDGRLDDKYWDGSNWETDFKQWEPYNGEKPSQKTEFKLLFNENNLFVGIRAYDTSPDSIKCLTFKRDVIGGDYVGVLIDSYHDLRTAFVFRVSSAGTKSDYIIFNDGDGYEITWDPIWYTKVSMDSLGWYAEMKIPFSQLRFENNSEKVWGLNVVRKIFRFPEINYWSHIPKDAPGLVHIFGKLENLQSIEPKKQLEVTPYIVGQTERFEEEHGNPFATGKKSMTKFGLDSKIGVSNNFIVDLTINPDFGQIEADPSEVNLTVFETFFEERRPFFVEGSNITSFDMGLENQDGNNNLFYSRRIGRKPSFSPIYNEGEYVYVPEFTRILGAAKITGKTSNGLSVGIIESVTDKVRAEIDLNGNRRYKTIEPLTNYFVGRIQKDFSKGETILGCMFTATNRKTGIDSLAYQMHTNSYTGGVDFTKAFHNRTYLLETQFAFSHLTGSKNSITKLQYSPIRQFQRPGIDHISVDSSLTSLTGTGGKLIFRKTGNGHFNYKVAFSWSSPGFELNDIGYLRSADNITQLVWGGYNIWKPVGIFKALDFNLSEWSEWDFGGTNLLTALTYSSNFLFTNDWNIITVYNYFFNINDPYVLRGGPYLKLPPKNSIYFNISTGIKRKLSASIFTSFTGSNNNYRNESMIGITLRFRPNSHLYFTLEPQYSTNMNKLQYVNTTSYSSDARYIMGTLDQNTFSSTIRLNYFILPNLSIEYWGQPFFSTGKFSDFKYINNPTSDNFSERFNVYSSDQIHRNEDIYEVDENGDGLIDYTFNNPDFSVRNFLSNLVFRWEFRPGSTVYLIWNQTQINNHYSQKTSVIDNFQKLFETVPHNVFLIKFSYRIGR